MRILIVAEHASSRFGGEAALPLHYFRVLRRRGMDVRMITHARVRDELSETIGADLERVAFIEDSPFHRLLWRIGAKLPDRLSYISTGFAMRMLTQVAQRSLARDIVAKYEIDVVHQPMPVSPREPSLMYELGAPVVIGPLNGNMLYPPSLQNRSGRLVSLIESVARRYTNLLNSLIPGKPQAAAIVVANDRTRIALPARLRGEVVLLPENGVDLTVWRPPEMPAVKHEQGPIHFVYLGRLVDWKAVDLLLLAFDQARQLDEMALTIVGDGDQKASLQTLVGELGLAADRIGEPSKVFFAGWRSQAECAAILAHSDALVLPSLWECGGAVVLEGMACSLPVIATAWGGPLDYLDDSSGILVQPSSREALIKGFATAMRTLSRSAELRLSMGAAGRRRVEADFDWERKVDVMYSIYSRVASVA